MKVKVVLSCLTLCDPVDYILHGILQARILQWVAFPFLGDLPKPGNEPRSPALQADFLPAEPQGKPKNTGVGSLSLLQQILPTQESYQGRLHYRQILYKLSYQEYASKFGKLISGHRTGKGQFSFQSQRKAMPKNVETTTQLHSPHMLAK